jgi:hypothetical protein
MGLVHVDSVGVVDRSELVAGFGLASPQQGDSTNVYGLTFEGWLVFRDGPVEQIFLETLHIGSRPVPVNITRPDIEAAYPDIDWARSSGFRASLGISEVPPTFDIRIVAYRPERTELGVIHGHRERLPSPDDLRFNPIMLTTMARTGGNWVSHLLGHHPSVLSLQPFQYEARVAAYWFDVFATLANPRSYLQSLGSELAGQYWWLQGTNLMSEPSAAPEPQFVEWLGSENIEDLLMLAHGRVQKTYERVARIHDRPETRFFMERCPPNSLAHRLLPEIYPDGREIILVRDFRDMVASILAYNRKRGSQFFGRHEAKSDAEFITKLGTGATWLARLSRQRSDTSYLLRYEDLVQEPVETLQSVLAYIGIDADRETTEKVLADAKSATNFAQEDHRTSASAEASIGRWRRDLESSLQEACEDAFGEVLSTLGYN